MKPVHFKEVNVTLAKNQPQYMPLPIQLNSDVPGCPAWCKYELTDAELAILNRTKSIYIQQLTFQEPMPLEDQPETTMGYHPIYPCVENPWKQLPIKYERLPFGTIAAWVPLVDDTEREIIGRTFDELVGMICVEFPELIPENLNFVMKNPPDIINNKN
jgi:hypothetical protein